MLSDYTVLQFKYLILPNIPSRIILNTRVVAERDVVYVENILNSYRRDGRQCEVAKSTI